MENLEFDHFNDVVNHTQLKILEHGYLYTGSEWNFIGLSSPFNRLYFVTSGNALIQNEHNRLEMQKSYVYLIPLNNTYNYICHNQLEKFYIHFRIEMYNGHDLFDGSLQCESSPIDTDAVMDLITYARSGDLCDLIKCKAILLDCISKFIKPHTGKIRERIMLASKYAVLYDFVKNNCFADLRIKDLANKMGTSASNLSKQFKNDTGSTLKKYIDDRVILKAQERLLTSNLPIKAVASELKFLDEFHFSRYFKRHVGLPPNTYRQRNNTYK